MNLPRKHLTAVLATLTIALAAAPGSLAADPVGELDEDADDAPAVPTACGMAHREEVGPVTYFHECGNNEVYVFGERLWPPAFGDAEADVDAPAVATNCLYIEESVGPVTYMQSCGYHQVYYEDEQVFAGHVP